MNATPKFDHQFNPGVSGNPNGRPKSVERLLAHAMPAIVNKAIERALAGDAETMRVLLEHSKRR